MSIDIIVIRYNLPEIEDRCLASVVKNTHLDYKLVVRDNYTTKLPLTEIWNNLAIESTAEWMVFLNSDCVVTNRWLERLLEIGNKDSKIAALGPATNAAPTDQGNFLPRGKLLEPPYSIPEEAERVTNEFFLKNGLKFIEAEITGFCYMVRHQFLQDISFFNEQFVFFGQETKANYDFRKAGYKVGWAPGVFIYHQGAAYANVAKKEGRNLGKEKDESMKLFYEVKDL